MRLTLPFPLDRFTFEGYTQIRGAFLHLPLTELVQLLPASLVPAHQTLSPRGCHPVVFLFNSMYDAHLSFPAPFPTLTYHEMLLGVPYVNVSDAFQASGPYFYMVQLYLDNFVADFCGRLWAGYVKNMADIAVDSHCYEIQGFGGEEICSLEGWPDWDFGCDGPRPQRVDDCPQFGAIREILDQPIVSFLPWGVGQMVIGTDFAKDWSRGLVAPIETVVRLGDGFVPGVSRGRFPAEGKLAGFDSDPLGCFAVQAPFLTSLPYPTWLHPAAKGGQRRHRRHRHRR